MPEPQAPAADGQAADGTTTTVVTTDSANAGQSGTKTFTQAELDQIVKDRVARAVPADYESAKAAAAELARIKEGEKSEIDKATEARASAEKERDETRTQLQREKLERAIEREAFAQGADAELVALALANSADITVKDGEISGVKAAVTKLLESKPHLKVGRARSSGGEFGGSDEPTLVEQIAALEAKGDKESLAKARELKIQQMQAMIA